MLFLGFSYSFSSSGQSPFAIIVLIYEKYRLYIINIAHFRYKCQPYIVNICIHNLQYSYYSTILKNIYSVWP